MHVLYQSCCGMDVHKRFVVACLLWQGVDGQQHKELCRYSTMTNDLLQCIDWLQAKGWSKVAMESTGVYWKPVFTLMEGRFDVVVVNAQHMKAVPGRKTDLKDAEWIAELLQHGLLKASFIPLRPQRELRDLTRYRLTLSQERTRLVNRLHKLLEEANLKLSSVLADMLCKTGRMILQALAKGEADPEKLADLGLAFVPAKRDALAKALCGRMHEHQRFVLRELLQMLDAQEWAIARLDRQIEERLRPFEETIQRLDAITGVSRHTIEVLFAEVGWDMRPFPDAAHLASWAGLCPGQHASGGKRMSGRARKGNRWVKTTLVQAAHAASKTQTYLGAQYRRLSARRGGKRAAVAVAHSILVIYYQLLTTGEVSQEKGVDYFAQLDQEHHQRRLIKQLERLGFQVTLTPQPSK